MENNNGRGIFYGVIGVATLIVAIIGATFAYFSATAASNENAVTTDAAKLELALIDYREGLKGSLIPVDADGSGGVMLSDGITAAYTNFKYYPGVSDVECTDDTTNNICSVYTFTIINDSKTAIQEVYGYLVPTQYTMTNLHFASFRGNSDQIIAQTATQYSVTGTINSTVISGDDFGRIGADGTLLYPSQQLLPMGASPKVSPFNQTFTIGETSYDAYSIPGWHQKLAPNNPDDTEKEHYCITGEGKKTVDTDITSCEGSGTPTGNRWVVDDSYATFTVILWIQEIGDDQTDADSLVEGGALFAGAVGFTTAGGGSGVTGNIATSSGHRS